MKITNRSGLPQAFVNMATNEYGYKPKRYSVTSLLKGTREILLTRRHDDGIQQDCSDMIWLLFGQAVHSILEKYADKNDYAEKKLAVTLDNGYTVSGILDCYNTKDNIIEDYKTASVWKVMFGDFGDWEKQGLLYDWQLRHAEGIESSKIRFTAILKDWSKNDAKRKSDYPKQPVFVFEFVPTQEKRDWTDNFVREKMDDIIKCEMLKDNELPMCSADERWKNDDKWRVMKKGRKTALRVLPTEGEAVEWQYENGGDYIEVELGVDRKCAEYCSCCEFCDYYQRNYAKDTEEETEETPQTQFAIIADMVKESDSFNMNNVNEFIKQQYQKAIRINDLTLEQFEEVVAVVKRCLEKE